MERMTIQKELVYSALVELHNHPTAEQIYERVRAEHPRVSRATVYRILNRMADAGEILRIPVANAADRFDHTLPVHFHIACDRCGKVEDIFDPRLDASLRAAGGSVDFCFSGYELLFHGLCRECAEKNG